MTDAAARPTEPWTALAAGELSGVLDHLADGIVVVDRQLRVQYMNEPAGRMLGRASGELLGKHMPSEFPDSAGGVFDNAFAEALQSGRATRIVEYYPPTERWFESWISPLGARTAVVFRDITDEHHAEEELREYVEQVAHAERAVRFGVWKWDVASGRVRWSDELHHIYGLRPGAYEGTLDAFTALVHPDDRTRVWSNISRSIETLEPFSFEERIVRPDGEVRVLLSDGRVIAEADGTPRALVGVCHDVTERTLVEQALGASERRIRAIIDNTPSIISVKDLDGRYVMGNAEFGRVVGVPAQELIGRRCVDVFPPGIADEQRENDLRAVREGQAVYGETVLVCDGEERTFATVTFALNDDDGTPIETCTIATDFTERKAREEERRDRLAWTRRISSALAGDRMVVFAQPVVDLRTGEHVACELLARLREGDDDLLEPAAFLPAAERHGLIQSIDVWMVGAALRRPAPAVTQVNLSALTMCDPAARREIVELLAAAPEAARRLVFEITETAAAAHLDAAEAFADVITRLGCRLALDDFGTGFGSFTYLRSLPVSYLKIDLSFVRSLATSPDDRRVVVSIIGIAREFGLQTIAEGVEDEMTLELLRELGADLVQGYHLGRPAPLHRG